MIRLPTQPTRTDPLLPYTPLFRSIQRHLAALAAPALKPGDGVLHPVRIIAFWIILVHVGAAAFLAVDCALDRALSLTDQIVEFERFDQICIPDQRLVGNIYILPSGIEDRKSVVWGKRVSVSVDPGGRRNIK